MKIFSYIFLLLAVAACQVEQRQEQIPEKSVEQKSEELLNAIYDFNLAFAAADATKLEDLLTEQYAHTNGSSAPYSKEVWLNYIKGRKTKIDSGVLVIDDYGMNDIKMTFYDKTALVNGVVYSRGSENEATFDKQFRVTHLWVYEDDRWKRAGFHDGVIK